MQVQIDKIISRGRGQRVMIEDIDTRFNINDGVVGNPYAHFCQSVIYVVWHVLLEEFSTITSKIPCMSIYNISKIAQQQQQGDPTMIAIQRQIVQIQMQLANLSKQPKNPNPQLEQQRQQQIEQLTAQYRQLFEKQSNFSRIIKERTRSSIQEQIRAILEGDDAVLSQMNADDYVAARSAFLKTVPPIQRGETIEMYSDRVREYIYRYNTKGDLVEPYTKMVINDINIKAGADRDRAQKEKERKDNVAAVRAARQAQQSAARRR